MFNLHDITEKDDNKKLIIGPSGSVKTNYLLNSIQKDNNIIDKILFVCQRFRRIKISVFD